MVNKGGKVSSSSAATGGKTSAAPGKGGKARAQDEKAIDETVSQIPNPISETKGEEEEEEERDDSETVQCLFFSSNKWISVKVSPAEFRSKSALMNR